MEGVTTTTRDTGATIRPIGVHHVSINVDDLDAAGAAAIELGATRHPHQLGTSYRVFLDPAGHPFCLCLE